MAITVKKGPNGFYVEGPLCDVMGVPLPDQPDPAMITHVRDLDDKEVTMFTLSDDNGFWYFANGVPLDGPFT